MATCITSCFTRSDSKGVSHDVPGRNQGKTIDNPGNINHLLIVQACDMGMRGDAAFFCSEKNKPVTTACKPSGKMDSLSFQQIMCTSSHREPLLLHFSSLILNPKHSVRCTLTHLTPSQYLPSQHSFSAASLWRPIACSAEYLAALFCLGGRSTCGKGTSHF